MELYVKKITLTEKKEKGEVTEKHATVLEDPEETMTVTIKEENDCSFELGDKWMLDKIESQSKLKD